jgi:hypothetical protein
VDHLDVSVAHAVTGVIFGTSIATAKPSIEFGSDEQ